MHVVVQLGLLAFAHGLGKVVAQAPPAEYSGNNNIGSGGTNFKDSPHFRFFNLPSTSVDSAIKMMEAAQQCFVNTLGWRTAGLPYSANNSGPYYKINIYGVAESDIPGAAAQQWTDAKIGVAYIKVVPKYVAEPTVIVHEFGHAMTYSEHQWVDQGRTGAWWETVAQFVADTFITSSLCESARTQYGQPEGNSMINVKKVIGDSFQPIVDGTSKTGNYYEAWPFLSYITFNPDNYTGIGTNALRDMFRKYKTNSNETPLHVLNRNVAPLTAQNIVGRYWARMAFVDIGSPKAQQAFTKARSSLNYANLDSTGTGTYRVKSSRQPQYMGANIIPLKNPGQVSVNITSTGTFTATLSIRAKSGTVRYIDLKNGSGQATVESGEEASIVVANTPALALYDPFSLTAEVKKGLDYTLQLSGATA